MLKIFSLYYKLNQFYFFNSNILLSDLPIFWKRIVYGGYIVARCFLYILGFMVINIYYSHSELKTNYYLGSQIILLLLSILVISKQSIISNRRIKILDFLLGNSFTCSERKSNIKKVGLYYSFFMLLIILIIDGNVLIFYRNEGFRYIFLTLLVASISITYTYWKSISINDSVSDTDRIKLMWLIQYIFASVASLLIINIFFVKNIAVHLKNNVLINVLSALFIILMLYILFDVLKLKRIFVLKTNKQKISILHYDGITRDFVEKYIRGSAWWLVVPSSFIRIISMTDLSKAITLVILFSFFLTPNFCSKPMINYTKLIGKSSTNFFVRYSVSISVFLIIAQIFGAILAGLNIKYIIISLLILLLVILLRTTAAIIVSKSGYNDNKKIDIFALTVMTSLLLLAACAYYWR